MSELELRNKCNRCGRDRFAGHTEVAPRFRVCPADKIVKIRVVHAYYGCDTGCCGMAIQLECDGGLEYNHFEFGHSNDGARHAAAELAAKLGLKECDIEIPDDLDTID